MQHTLNMRARRSSYMDDSDGYLIGPPVTIIQNDEKNRVEMHIRGDLPPPQVVSMELTTLDKMASSFNTLVVYINTPGGSGDTLTELLSIMKRYKTIITVSCGQAASAGFIIWCAGHVRVVQEYSVLMAHRESYEMRGKTEQHLSVASFNQKNFSRLLSRVCGHVLSEAEQETAKITEVFLSAEDAINRKVAISWEDFITRDNQGIETVTYVMVGDSTYQLLDEDTIADPSDPDGTPININQIMYGLPYKI